LKGKLETEIVHLKSANNVLTPRLALATEQQKAATGQAEILKVELAQLKAKTSRGEQPSPTEIRNATTVLDIALQRFLVANNAVTSTLTIPHASDPPDVPSVAGASRQPFPKGRTLRRGRELARPIRRFWQMQAEVIEGINFFGNLPTYERGTDLGADAASAGGVQGAALPDGRGHPALSLMQSRYS
jgi:hypothetical protein